MEPFFRSIGPSLVVPDIRLKFFYSIFRCTNLQCQLVSDPERVLVIILR